MRSRRPAGTGTARMAWPRRSSARASAPQSAHPARWACSASASAAASSAACGRLTCNNRRAALQSIGRARAVQVGVAQDAEQPRLGPARVAELRPMHLGLAEGLLRQVLGVGGRAGQAIGVAVQGGVVLLDQPLYIPLTAGQTHGGNPS